MIIDNNSIFTYNFPYYDRNQDKIIWNDRRWNRPYNTFIKNVENYLLHLDKEYYYIRSHFVSKPDTRKAVDNLFYLHKTKFIHRINIINYITDCKLEEIYI